VLTFLSWLSLLVVPCSVVLQVVQGTAALELLFGTVGLGWAVNLMELPIISKMVDLLYEFLSANRISLGNALVSAPGTGLNVLVAAPGSFFWWEACRERC